MNSSATPTDLVFSTLGTRFGSGCLIDVIGNVRCTGSKSALVSVEGGSSRVALCAVEATENWFEDVGSAQLSKGSATITLERTFAETVNTGEDYHVFLTPRGECDGLYVSNANAMGFEVHELRHGTSNVGFDFKIMARRRGYEKMRLEKMPLSFQESVLLKGAAATLSGTPTKVVLPKRP